MKNKFFFLSGVYFFLVYLSSTFAQSGWVQQSSGTNFTLNDVQFINSNTGFIVGVKSTAPYSSIFLKTTNAGINWISYPNANRSLSGLYFFDSNNGFLAGVADSNIQKTTDGGNIWLKPLGTGFLQKLKILFINSTVGYSVGPDDILKSTDGGLSWFSTFNLTKAFLKEIIFTNTLTGYVVGGSNNGLKTTNTGNNWLSYPTLNGYTSISNSGENNIIASNSTSILRSTNSGVNWSIVFTNSVDSALYTIKYIDENTIIAAGYPARILKSTNGGNNWARLQSSVTNVSLNRIFFINSLTGWIVGNNGTILKTTTGGITVGINQVSTNIPDCYSISQNYPNPFNPKTVIRFQIPVTGHVSIKVFDEKGSEVASLVNEILTEGEFKTSFDGSKFASGIYFYRIKAGEFVDTKRMVLMK